MGQLQDFLVPVSAGEVVDKITILQIKSEQITDTVKLANVQQELVALEESYQANIVKVPPDVEELSIRLRNINQQLWEIEDQIRDCERAGDFGEVFIKLARAVYFTNDERSRVKRDINVALGSRLVEEKSYKDYARQAES